MRQWSVGSFFWGPWAVPHFVTASLGGLFGAGLGTPFGKATRNLGFFVPGDPVCQCAHAIP